MPAAADLTLRPATSADISRLAEIERAAARLFPAGYLPDPQATLPTTVLEQAITDGLLIVACTESEPVGFAVAEVIDGWLHLIEVSVDPAFGRRGLGRALVTRVMDTSHARSLIGVSLTTFSDLPWNAPFYQRLGFEAGSADALPSHVAAHLEAETSSGMRHRVGMCWFAPARKA